MSRAEDRIRPFASVGRFVSLLALASAVAFLPACENTNGGAGGDGGETTRSADTTGQTEQSPIGENSVAEAAQAVMPSVVFVANQQAVPNPETGEPSSMPVGSGSGVIIREDGHILTNNHVIADSDGVIVRIDGDDLEAKIVGCDPATDLAVIKVDREGLTAAKVGDPDSLVVGQWVVAVGFPFGLDRTVTAGVVSALGRSTIQPGQNEVTAYTNLVQTDAPINPGNSGGALADLQGRVVGINTLIESATGQSAGIGFAIPMDFAMDVAEQLIETGKAEHTFMGVSISSSNPHGAPGEQRGALVEGVEPRSPAAEAGIRQGDVIIRIGEETIETSDDVFAAVRSRRPGDKVEVEVRRGDGTETLEVTLTGRTSVPGE